MFLDEIKRHKWESGKDDDILYLSATVHCFLSTHEVGSAKQSQGLKILGRKYEDKGQIEIGYELNDSLYEQHVYRNF
jgi:hypothetical protein